MLAADSNGLKSNIDVDLKFERTEGELTYGAYGELSATSSASVDSTADWEDRYIYMKSGPHALYYGDTDGGLDKRTAGIDTGGLGDEADFYATW